MTYRTNRRTGKRYRLTQEQARGMSTEDYIRYKMEREIRDAKAKIQHKYRVKYGDDILD